MKKLYDRDKTYLKSDPQSRYFRARVDNNKWMYDATKKRRKKAEDAYKTYTIGKIEYGAKDLGNKVKRKIKEMKK